MARACARVERRPQPGALLRVGRDDAAFIAAHAATSVGEHVGVARDDCRGALLDDRRDALAAGHERVLRDLAEPAAVLAVAAACVSVATSANTAIGWWNAPTRFLPSGRFTPVLPPIAASTFASSVVGTCTTLDAAVVDGGGEAGGVADDSPAERDDRVVAQETPRGEAASTGRRRWRATWRPRRRR